MAVSYHDPCTCKLVDKPFLLHKHARVTAFCEACQQVNQCLHYNIVICCYNNRNVFPARQMSLWWATQIKLSMAGEGQM